MKQLTVSTCVFLLSLLTGCAETPVTTKTEYRQVFLPDRFLIDCPVPVVTAGMTYRELAALAAKRKTALLDCNAQLRAARDYQADIQANPEKSGLK